MKRLALVLTLAVLATSPALAEEHAKDCCMKMDGVAKQVANLDNGVKLTLTSKDAATVAKLQEKMAGAHDKSCTASCPMCAEGVTKNVEKVADGVVITATATDAALVKKLQEHAAGAGCSHDHAATAAKACGHAKHEHSASEAHHDCCMKMDGVARQVANLDNGVKLTLTSKDAATVTQLQAKMTGEHAKSCTKSCPMCAEGVTKNVEKIADGVVVTATATDAALVKKLQEHAAGAGCSHEHAAAPEKSCPHHAKETDQASAAPAKGCPMGGHHDEVAAGSTPAKKSCPMGDEAAKACAKPSADSSTTK